MTVEELPKNAGVRERVLLAAYELFSRDGIKSVSVDAIVAHAGCARASLYNIFGSKDELVAAFLRRREQLRTRVLLENEVRLRAELPEERLLVVFDVLDRWLKTDDFRHCTLIKMMLEAEPDSYVHTAVRNQLAKVREMVRGFAEDAELERPVDFARVWHMLIKGAIVSGHEGDADAAAEARRAGEIILAGWPRRS
jgi:AcrR family transcriptional regulator